VKKVLFSLFFLIALFSPFQDSFSEERIKIGISCALSGHYAPLAKVYLAGWETYLKKVNKEGGINGTKLQWRVLDDKYMPKRAVANTEKLIDWGAKILAGYVGIDAVRETIAYIEKEKIKIPFFFPLTSSRFINVNIKGQLYSLRIETDKEVSLILSYFIRNYGISNWGVFYEGDYTGEAGKDIVERSLSDYNLRPVYEYSHKGDPKKVDVGDVKEKRPDVIIVIASAVVSRVYIKKIAEAFGKENMPYVITLSSVFPCSYVKKVSKYVAPGKFWFTQVTPHPKDKRYAIVREYLRDLKRFSLGEKPCFVSLEGYLAAKVMCDIIARAGSVDVSAIKVSAERTKMDVGLGSKITFNPIVHRSPLGVGLYEVLDSKPTVKTILWNDLTHLDKKEENMEKGGSEKTDIKGGKNDEKVKIDVKIKEVAAVEKGKTEVLPKVEQGAEVNAAQ